MGRVLPGIVTFFGGGCIGDGDSVSIGDDFQPYDISEKFISATIGRGNFGLTLASCFSLCYNPPSVDRGYPVAARRT